MGRVGLKADLELISVRVRRCNGNGLQKKKKKQKGERLKISCHLQRLEGYKNTINEKNFWTLKEIVSIRFVFTFFPYRHNVTTVKTSGSHREGWLCCVVLHINLCSLFNTKSIIYIYIDMICKRIVCRWHYFYMSHSSFVCTQLNSFSRRCPWCNGYRRRKWTRWHEFKS